MKNIRKALAVILAALVLVSTFAVTSFAAPSSKDRYSVLVLDVSGSMSGNKIAELKVGATKFCEFVLSSNRSNNQVAIVTFASGSSLVCDFTNDLETLKTTIEGLRAGGGTDLTGGINKGKAALEPITGDVIKNMLVMCDGEPNNASTAYNAVMTAPRNWNIYGLYYCPNGYSTSAANVMFNVGRNGYYSVPSAQDLDYAFFDNSSEVTTKSVNGVVVRIACPVDVAVTIEDDTQKDSYGNEISLKSRTLDKNNTQTTFGTLTFEGENNEIKVLDLAYNDNYKIEITGYAEGTMDYSIEYYCNEDLLYNLDYPTVNVDETTVINTGVDVDDSSMTLDYVDANGNVVDTVSPNVSTTSIWYKIQMFFDELIYKIKEFFAKIGLVF